MTERMVSTDEQLIIDLKQWASEYVDNSAGKMVALPYDSDKYPSQDKAYFSGDPADPALVDGIASLAQPRYHEVLSLLEQQESQTGYIGMIGELLNGGNSVELVTNHSDLIDVAIAHAALYSTLSKQGYEMRTGIIISKMVAFLAYKIGAEFAPCTDVLKILESETYLSYPKTESTKKHLKDRLLPNEVDKHNKHMRRRVVQKLGEGGMLLAMAASGTTDKPSREDPATIYMSQIGIATAELMQAPKTYVAPMAIWYNGTKPVMKLSDIPRVIKNESMAHSAMDTIATALTEAVPDYTFLYTI